MNKGYIKYLLIATLIIGIIGLVNYASAESQIQSLSPQKQNSNINLPQSCANSTYANITVIYYPNSNYALAPGQYKMTENSNDFYNYTFTKTFELGNYIVYGNCDENGVYTPWAYNFNVSPSGIVNTSHFLYLFLIIILLVFLAGTKLENNWIMMLGSILVIILGFYVIINGIDVIKDTRTTWAVGIIIWALGIYFMFLSTEGALKEWG